MVGNYAEREAAHVFMIFFSADFFYFCNQWTNQVGIVVAFYILDNGCDTFQPHTGIDTWTRQRSQYAVFVTVILHKYQIPDFQPAVTVTYAQCTAIRMIASVFFAAVNMNFTARTTWAGFPHLPEVVLFAQANDTFFRYRSQLTPQFISFIVIFVDGDI